MVPSLGAGLGPTHSSGSGSLPAGKLERKSQELMREIGRTALPISAGHLSELFPDAPALVCLIYVAGLICTSI